MSFDLMKTMRSLKEMNFEHNVGEKDQRIRFWGGVALIAITLFLGNVFLLLLGIILIGTAKLGWCPVYSAMHKSTCQTTPGPENSADS